jgi:hypothetical protein
MLISKRTLFETIFTLQRHDRQCRFYILLDRYQLARHRQVPYMPNMSVWAIVLWKK